MKTHKYTELEVKLTAILYATREDVVRHVVNTGTLPAIIPLGGFPTAMNVLLRRRGLDATLTRDELIVQKAIQTERVLPGGGVILIEDRFPIYSVEPDQCIEICPVPRNPNWED